MILSIKKYLCHISLILPPTPSQLFTYNFYVRAWSNTPPLSNSYLTPSNYTNSIDILIIGQPFKYLIKPSYTMINNPFTYPMIFKLEFQSVMGVGESTLFAWFLVRQMPVNYRMSRSSIPARQVTHSPVQT